MSYRTGYRFLSLMGQAHAASRGGVTGLLRNRRNAYAHRLLAQLLRGGRR